MSERTTVDEDFNRMNARLEEALSVLRAIRDECDDTGGEFWEGTNVETSDRMRALLGEAVDPPNE